MAPYSVVRFVLVSLLCLAISTVTCKGNVISGNSDGSEKWGYIEVRPHAHMFWWLYYSPGQTSDNWPLILWLQGGPGASGVAMGNFQEIGPFDTQFKPRKTTWLQKADLLFVDSPVGTGFSYVEKSSLVATTDAEVTADLLRFLEDLFCTITTLQKRPLFIVGESYGGKHASMMGLALSKAIAAGEMKANLAGVLLGDSWISPVDYVLSWGPLLLDVSRLEAAEKDDANSIALQIEQQVKSGEYIEAINSWVQLEMLISSQSNKVDFYNFLLDSSADPLSSPTSTLQSTPGHYSQYLSSKENKKESGHPDLATFMNVLIREKLKIIPPNRKWNDQHDLVFQALQSDFMKSVVDQVDELLSRGENVTIYNGQVDLICATIGTEAWVQKLKWLGLREFNSIGRTPLYCDGSETKGFVKTYKNLRFFWVLGAGHFVPVDQPCLALEILNMVITSPSF